MNRPLHAAREHFRLRDQGYQHSPEHDIWTLPEFTGTSYSDGECVEERIAAILAGAKDLSLYSPELQRQCSDWPSRYHLSGCRANILRPFCSRKHGSVLEIGSGCGAITRFLGESGANVLAVEGSRRRAAMTRSRTRDLSNVVVVCDNFSEFQTDHRFDLITLIGVLEYAGLYMEGPSPFKALLEKACGMLTPDGSLIIAIENQLGLKYFAGYPEDHLGKPMYGVEGRYGAREARTFGRKALAELLRSAGFATHEFMAPFPDYKFAASIVTEEGFNADDFDASAFAWQSVRRDPQMPPTLHFAQEAVWPEIIGNGLGLELANSFLIRATPGAVKPKSDLAYHYSTQRAPQYCKETCFRRRPDGRVGVFTQRLFSQAAVEGKEILFSPKSEADYVSGRILAYDFVRIVTSQGWRMEDVAEFFRGYRAVLVEIMAQMGLQAGSLASGFNISVPGSMFDVLPHNIVRSGDGRLHAIDIEWTVPFDLDFRNQVFRSVMVLLGLVAYVRTPENGVVPTYGDFVKTIFVLLGLPCSSEDLEEFANLDARIQSLTRGIPTSSAGDAREAFWWKDLSLPSEENIIHLRHRLAYTQALESQVLDLQIALESFAKSRSWRLTAPLRQVAMFVRNSMTIEKIPRVERMLRSCYQRLPLPVEVKKILRLMYYRWLRRLFNRIQGVSVNSAFVPTDRRPVPQGDMPDYFVWGVIDWHFRHQRPQQLALAIAESGSRVFYVSSNLVDDGRPGFAVEALDSDSRVFQVNLFAKGAPSIYSSAPCPETIAHIRQSIGEVLDWADSRRVVSLVDHPFWYDIARVVPNSRLVYDCMDHHEGFGNNGDALLRLEQRLIAEADVTITTSSWLESAVAPHARKVEILRNACDYEHFSRAPTVVRRDPNGRPVIGYYGAIAEWFDLDLVEAVATSLPECSVMLIGADTINAKARLGKLPNVTFTGEVSYSQLPQYLHGFDVCLLPFRIIPLTLATNPVKAYEYLSAGKPVVAVDLPEMSQFGGLIRVAADHDEFVRVVRESVEAPESGEIARMRRAFARSQTWGHRARSLRKYSEDFSDDPRVSVVVVTYNNIELTKACLASIDAHSQYGNLEVIVVDNASSDGTQGYLEGWVSSGPDRKIITNGQNRGFAAANNQGLAAATGDYLVLLNNDTYVTPGWVRTLARHLERDRTIGLIGPVTNNIGNEAKIDISYDNMDEMLTESAKYTRRHIGQLYPLRTAAFFCAMMPRAVYERVGDLDESFGRGFFEDDDYCRRIEQVELRIVCAEDVFVHHHLSATFGKISNQERKKLFEKNRMIYESKWGQWKPHSYR